MSRAIDRHRARHEAITGTPIERFGESSDDAKNYSQLAALAAGGIGEIVSKQLADKEAEKKAAAARAANAEGDAAKKLAQDARKNATMLSADAAAAQAKANANPNDKGLADAAKAAALKATNADADARAAEMKAVYYQTTAAASGLPGGFPGMPGAPGYGAPGPQKASIFTPTNILIGVGVLLGGAVAFKLLTRSK